MHQGSIAGHVAKVTSTPSGPHLPAPSGARRWSSFGATLLPVWLGTALAGCGGKAHAGFGANIPVLGDVQMTLHQQGTGKTMCTFEGESEQCSNIFSVQDGVIQGKADGLFPYYCTMTGTLGCKQKKLVDGWINCTYCVGPLNDGGMSCAILGSGNGGAGGGLTGTGGQFAGRSSPTTSTPAPEATAAPGPSTGVAAVRPRSAPSHRPSGPTPTTTIRAPGTARRLSPATRGAARCPMEGRSANTSRTQATAASACPATSAATAGGTPRTSIRRTARQG